MYKFLKRLGDIFFSVLLLIVVLPIFLPLAILVKISSPGPVFFKQARPGKNEKIFMVLKFRTMKLGDEPDYERKTRIGSFLRATSLDELPQLINVVKGEMSFIGPRPLLVEYLPLYNEVQKDRHIVRPGISGLAQVSGRNAISWEEKFSLDVKYVNNISLLLDIRIAFLTVLKVIRRAGVNSSDTVTMEKFKGSKK